MKKFFAVLLAVLMLPVFALAEEAQSVTVKVNDTLSIAVNVPDGYAFDQTWYGDVLYAQIKPEEEGKLLMVLSLGYSEEYADRSINDLNSENDEYAEIFTVYQGYFIGLLLEPAGDVQVSQEELDLAVQFLSDMQFVHTEA